ncbi:hypothetical protein HK102_005411, partial [Quaeritorhiza haematococci]
FPRMVLKSSYQYLFLVTLAVSSIGATPQTPITTPPTQSLQQQCTSIYDALISLQIQPAFPPNSALCCTHPTDAFPANGAPWPADANNAAPLVGCSPRAAGGELTVWGLQISNVLGCAGTTIPSFRDLPNLKYLAIEGCELPQSRIPWDAVARENRELEYLRLSKCKLSGMMSLTVGNLETLKELDLSNNALTGNLPTTIGKLTNLRNLNVADNQLNGPLPTDLSEMTNLVSLNLKGNLFSGTLPNISGLTNLQSCQLPELCPDPHTTLPAACSSTATSLVCDSTSVPGASNTNTTPSRDASTSNTPMIIGIVVGSLLILTLIAGGIYFFMRRRRTIIGTILRETEFKQQKTQPATSQSTKDKKDNRKSWAQVHWQFREKPQGEKPIYRFEEDAVDLNESGRRDFQPDFQRPIESFYPKRQWVPMEREVRDNQDQPKPEPMPFFTFAFEKN